MTEAKSVEKRAPNSVDGKLQATRRTARGTEHTRMLTARTLGLHAGGSETMTFCQSTLYYCLFLFLFRTIPKFYLFN